MTDWPTDTRLRSREDDELEGDMVEASGARGNRVDQREYYDQACDREFEVTRPHGCGRVYEFLIARKFRDGTEVLGFDLRGRPVLEVCCGSGMMSEDLARLGARVTGIDFSEGAIVRAAERARRFDFAARFLVADVEALPFGDQSFAVVAVHDGLHHLDDPYRALREMTRVAKDAVLILEPARAALTRYAVALGFSEEVEEAGNYVHRFRAVDLAQRLEAEGFGRIRWRRTLMYYPHEPYAWFRWLDAPWLFALFRAGYTALNILAGRWGNKLALAAIRGQA